MPQRNPNFLLIGCGFISARHLEAIHAVGGTVGARLDIDQSKETQPSREGLFFYNPQALEQFGVMGTLPYVSICTPNDTHLEIAQRFAKYGCHILVEKPAALSLEQLQAYQHLPNVRFVLQLRYNLQLQELQRRWQDKPPAKVKMEFHVHRSATYQSSWKTDPRRSGGVLFNIGAHYFDLMTWCFGEPVSFTKPTGDDVTESQGSVTFKKTTVDYSFSLKSQPNQQTRAMVFGSEKIDLMPFFLAHHGDVYADFIEGGGFTWKDCEPSIRLMDNIRSMHDPL